MKKTRMILTGVLLLGILLTAGCGQRNRKENIQSAKDRPVTEESGNLDFTAKGIRKLAVSRGGKALYTLAYIPEENMASYEYWRMEAPYEDTVIVNTEEMLKLYEILEGLSFKECREAPPDAGIDHGDTEILLEFCQAGEYADSRLTILVGKADGEGHYYTALKSEPEKIFLMDQSGIDQVTGADPFSLILKVGAVVPVTTVGEVRITVDGTKHTMRAEKEEYFYDGETVNQEEYKQLYQKLLGVLLEKELPDGYQENRGKSLLRLEFIRSVDNLDDVTVEYLEYDDAYCVLRVNKTEKFLVSKEAVNELIAAIENRQTWEKGRLLR